MTAITKLLDFVVDFIILFEIKFVEEIEFFSVKLIEFEVESEVCDVFIELVVMFSKQPNSSLLFLLSHFK